jgi:hypothetical protein
MRTHWRRLFDSAIMTLISGIMFFGSIMAAGCLFMACEGWWKLIGVIAFATGCFVMPLFVMSFGQFREAMEEPVRLLRWRCQRLRAALHEPPPSE